MLSKGREARYLAATMSELRVVSVALGVVQMRQVSRV